MTSSSAGTRSPRAVEACHLVLLDQFEVAYGDRPVQLTSAAQRLVAFLALEGRPRSRERIAATLWPATDQPHATANVRRALFSAQRLLPGAIEVDGHALSLCAQVRVDVHEYGLTSAHRFGTLPIPDDFAVFAAELLTDWPDAWLAPMREPLHELRLRRLEQWAHELLLAGRPHEALDAAWVAARIDPLRESVQRLVVQAHLAQGNRANAVRQYRAYEAELWRELRLRPGEDLDALLGFDQSLPRAGTRRMQRV
jgi:DNA-binding SARP family transcriptional activator